jgi:hypothetical protein
VLQNRREKKKSADDSPADSLLHPYRSFLAISLNQEEEGLSIFHRRPPITPASATHRRRKNSERNKNGKFRTQPNFKNEKKLQLMERKQPPWQKPEGQPLTELQVINSLTRTKVDAVTWFLFLKTLLLLQKQNNENRFRLLLKTAER